MNNAIELLVKLRIIEGVLGYVIAAILIVALIIVSKNEKWKQEKDKESHEQHNV